MNDNSREVVLKGESAAVEAREKEKKICPRQRKISYCVLSSWFCGGIYNSSIHYKIAQFASHATTMSGYQGSNVIKYYLWIQGRDE